MNIEELNTQFSKSAPGEILRFFLKEYEGRIAFASSMGAEDQVLTEMISKINPETKIFTLNTGRLFKETLDLIPVTEKTYNITIDICLPDPAEVENMVKKKGIDLFYESVENRKLCCGIRKISPLKKALTGMSVWICGLRREQSISRYATPLVENDLENNLLKVNPLFEWTEAMVWDYIKKNNVPYNKLHDQGFPSIGCQPCTRAIKQGEDIRAGRWWWEEQENKECGLHESKI